jgi:hypothetical protein
MPKQRSKEENREYMREYMRRRRRERLDRGRGGECRPIMPPPASYADLAALVFGDPPIGRRAIDQRHLAEAAP